MGCANMPARPGTCHPKSRKRHLKWSRVVSRVRSHALPLQSIAHPSKDKQCLVFPAGSRLLSYSSRRKEEFLLDQQQAQPIGKHHNGANEKNVSPWNCRFPPMDFSFTAVRPNCLPFPREEGSSGLISRLALWGAIVCLSRIAFPLLHLNKPILLISYNWLFYLSGGRTC